jgi:hypothetical protein
MPTGRWPRGESIRGHPAETIPLSASRMKRGSSLPARARSSNGLSPVSKTEMRSWSTLLMAATLFLLACDTAKEKGIPDVEQPLLVQRSPMKTADAELPGFEAYAVWDCSPGDVPYAVRVYVATDARFTTLPPEVPHFRIEVFRAGTELSHRTLHWPADDGFAKLELCAGRSHCRRVTDSRVVFGAVRPNHFVEGTVERPLATGVITRWRFKANWGPRLSGCG